jgi:hypothetical protein
MLEIEVLLARVNSVEVSKKLSNIAFVISDGVWAGIPFVAQVMKEFD